MSFRQNMTFEQLSRQRKRHLRMARSSHPVIAARAVKEAYDYILNIDMDLNWHQAILDGSWQDSVRILEQALARAREQEKLCHGNLPIDPVSR